MNLKELGWDEQWEELYKQYKKEGYDVGRIIADHRHIYKVCTETLELTGSITGKMRYRATCAEEYPVVGDWVIIEARMEEKGATIHEILSRKSKFSRKEAGNITQEQVLAANVDTVFLVNAVNKDFNIRRIERYLILAWESGAKPVIVLTKADTCENLEELVSQVEEIAFGVPIHVTSSILKEGLEELEVYFSQGKTVALLGSSGVGKSTLINALMGKEVQKVGEIREKDEKGKHTTTHRELLFLPKGGIIIDTPGMRELQLWEGTEGIGETFEDIEELALCCKFRNCKHEGEPGCAVQGAILEGALNLQRLENYRKLQKEIRYFERKQDQRLMLEEKKKWKSIHKQMR